MNDPTGKPRDWREHMRPVYQPWYETKGTVYVAWMQGSEFVKVGFTTGDPEKRVRAAQHGCPTPVLLIGWKAAARAEERDFHERFRAQRACGEWFRMNAEMKAVLSSEFGVAFTES